MNKKPPGGTPWSDHARSEQLHDVLAQGLPFMAGTLILSTSLAFIFWNQVARLPLAVTWGALNLLFFLWWHFYRSYMREMPSLARIRPWVRGAELRAGLNGVCWGLYSLALFVPESIAYQTINVAFMFGIAVGALPVCGALYRGMLMFAIPALLPVIVRCFTDDSVALGFAGLAGLGFVVYAGRMFSRIIMNSLENRLRNEALALELEKQKQTAVDALDRAEEANLAKSRFLAAASHDLRQPIHTLGLFVAAARHPSTEQEHALILDRIESNVDSLAALFDSLLDISRLDANILQPQIADLALRPLLERLAGEHSPDAHAKKLDLRLRCPDLHVQSDRLLLERMIRNLITNAIRYTDRGGILLACRKRGAHARVEVWDTGRGIAPEQQPRIFEEFYQVGNSERDRRKGVGLGLAIVQRIGRLLNHPLQVASRPGRGSRFSVDVRIAESAVQMPCAINPAAETDDSVLLGAVVVVIDDEFDILSALELLLKRWGCRVLTADSAEKALQQLRASAITPDAVLSDFRLRDGATGIAAISALRSEFGADVPALLVTGDTAVERLREAASNSLEMLHKPVSADQLRSALMRLLA